VLTKALVPALLLAGMLVPGCESTPAAEPGAMAPMDVTGDMDSTWEYLAVRYDTNGDGRITEIEYARVGGRFDRLDHDGDGAITAADFESGGGQAAMMRGMRAQMVVARYFQSADGATNRLELEELRVAVAAYDTNGDGTIDAAEFAAAAEGRRVSVPGGDSRMMRRAMRDVDPWEALVDGIDADADETLSDGEMVAFFKDRDDGDLVWQLRDPGSRSPRAQRPSGPPEGELAPDFTLLPPEGGSPVTLSSFRGNLPVALVFGSYT
jgi:Ca2+-binding EF-hand superfamily protein